MMADAFLCFAATERQRERRAGDRLLAVAETDLSELLLVLGNIVLQSKQETLGVLRRHDYAALHVSLLNAG